LETFGWSLGSAASFTSNLYFWRTLDYFGEGAATNPLLHTWSLGAEEQFYLVFPFLMLLVSRFAGGHYRRWIAAATIALLALQLAGGREYADYHFFLLSMRGWQLGAGAVIALSALPGLNSGGVRSWSTGAGLALILLAVTGLPGPPLSVSLSGTLGALLFVGYGADAKPSHMLALAPIQWLGRTSYSVYLWHWPIVILCLLLSHGPATLAQKCGMLVASLVAGTLSYVIVERPGMARLRAMNARLVIAGALGVGALAVASGAALVHFSDQLRGYSPADQAILQFMNYDRWGNADMRPLPHDCDYNIVGVAVFEKCVRRQPAARNVILFGDSHAGMLAPGLVKRQPNVNIIKVAGAGCRPFMQDPGTRACVERKAYLLKNLVGTQRINRVVLAVNWRREDEPELRRVVAQLQAKDIPVTLVGPQVKYAIGLPRLLLSHDPAMIDRARDLDRAVLDKELERLAAAMGVQYASPYQINCPAGRCMTQLANGTPFQWDSNHLTREGADYVIARFPQF
jgi:hypothetical protein